MQSSDAVANHAGNSKLIDTSAPAQPATATMSPTYCQEDTDI